MFIVFRHGPDFPRDQWAEAWEGKWIEHESVPIGRPGNTWSDLVAMAMARPTGRYETRDDGARAEVWEIGRP